MSSVHGELEVQRVNGGAVALATPPKEVRTGTDHLANIQRLGNILAASGYFSDVKDMAQAAVKVMAGEELGIAPVAAVMGIHIIKGKVTLSANLIAAQVKRHGYSYRHVQFDNTGCSLEFIGKGGELLGLSSFTEADAKAAGVFSDMYRKFPRNMYFSRAMSNGAKWYCPEVTCGLPVYVPEELGAKVDGDGEVVHDEKPEPQARGSKEAAQAVAERKLAEMREANRKRDEALNVSKADVDVIMDGHTEELPSETEAQLAESIKRADPDKFKALNEFGDLKKKIIEETGSDDLYYRALGDCGFEKSNQVPTKDMRKVYKAVQKCFTDWKAAQPLDEA